MTVGIQCFRFGFRVGLLAGIGGVAWECRGAAGRGAPLCRKAGAARLADPGPSYSRLGSTEDGLTRTQMDLPEHCRGGAETYLGRRSRVAALTDRGVLEENGDEDRSSDRSSEGSGP